MKIPKSFALKVNSLKTEIYTLYLAFTDPRVPWYARVFLFLLIAYALSPVDIIPDIIPFLGFLDDIIILSVGIFLVTKMIPVGVIGEYRNQARSDICGLKFRLAGLTLVLFVWIALLVIIFLILT